MQTIKTIGLDIAKSVFQDFRDQSWLGLSFDFERALQFE